MLLPLLFKVGSRTVEKTHPKKPPKNTVASNFSPRAQCGKKKRVWLFLPTTVRNFVASCFSCLCSPGLKIVKVVLVLAAPVEVECVWGGAMIKV